MFTLSQIAELLNIHYNTARNLVNKVKLKPHHVVGTTKFYDEQSIHVLREYYANQKPSRTDIEERLQAIEKDISDIKKVLKRLMLAQ